MYRIKLLSNLDTSISIHLSSHSKRSRRETRGKRKLREGEEENLSRNGRGDLSKLTNNSRSIDRSEMINKMREMRGGDSKSLRRMTRRNRLISDNFKRNPLHLDYPHLPYQALATLPLSLRLTSIRRRRRFRSNLEGTAYPKSRVIRVSIET